jgi:YggT family protein
MYVLGMPLLAAVNILSSILTIYSFVVIAAVLISWVGPDPYNPVVRILRQLTEPVFSLIRRFTPRLGAIDLSPVVVLLIIMFIQQGIFPVLHRLITETLLG